MIAAACSWVSGLTLTNGVVMLAAFTSAASCSALSSPLMSRLPGSGCASGRRSSA
jgi:hypothetical protein